MPYYPANYRYEKANTLRVMVKFNRNTEPDLVEHVEGKDNKAGYLKRLVREDMRRGEGEGSGQ